MFDDNREGGGGDNGEDKSSSRSGKKGKKGKQTPGPDDVGVLLSGVASMRSLWDEESAQGQRQQKGRTKVPLRAKGKRGREVAQLLARLPQVPGEGGRRCREPLRLLVLPPPNPRAQERERARARSRQE